MGLATRWPTAIGIWALGVAFGSTWQIGRFVEHERKRLTDNFDRAFVQVAQHLDQNEALLDGLAALLRSSRDRTFPELRQYASEMLQRYPHLYTVGYQPRVDLDGREAFEQRMSRQLGRPFRIRDFSFVGDRSWRVSPPRQFYFPVTFMAPELPEARHVIGYDVHDDARFRAAIWRSHESDQPIATLPFDLVEGGRGYIYLRALRLGAAADAGAAPEHLISLLIRADRLLAGAHPLGGARLELRHRDAPDAGAALIGSVGSVPDAASRWTAGLPMLQLQRDLPSRHQPFALALQARLLWRDFAWPLWSLWLAAWTLLAAAGLAAALALQRARTQRMQAQRQTALAHEDLAAAERRAEVSRQRSLDELGSGIAHELNQPLAAVVGYSQAALRLLDASSAPAAERIDALRDTLRANAEQALRAGELIHRLRALVRRRSLQMQVVCMQDVVAGALRLERARIEAAGVQIEQQLAAAPVEVRGDALLLEQLLTNLLRNAVEALTQVTSHRHIAIALQADAAQCRLFISDNGPGLSADHMQRAFHPFQTTKDDGVGIGLVVCATIAQSHGGTIVAERREGGGARFVVTLPVAFATTAVSSR
jgi:signal transduction histidine kinase